MTSKQKPQPEAQRLDPAAMARLYADIAEKSGALISKFMTRKAGQGMPEMKDELGIAKAFFDAWGQVFADPMRMAELQMKLWQDYMSLWQNSMLKMMGQSSAPVAEPLKTDRRFRHDDWENNFLYDYVKQSYLIAARHLHHSLASVDGLDDKTAKKVDFYTRQYIDALSPSNFLITNPEAMRETVNSGGQNLVKGLNNLLEDLSRGDGEQLKVRMTDSEAFSLGGNLAMTKGKVVFQNDIMQLIQYEPLTDKVHATPLLIIPPWINKFYILDMRENNSFVRWAVEQGHTVFMASWRNVDAEWGHLTWDDYLEEGVMKAIAVARASFSRTCLAAASGVPTIQRSSIEDARLSCCGARPRDSASSTSASISRGDSAPGPNLHMYPSGSSQLPRPIATPTDVTTSASRCRPSACKAAERWRLPWRNPSTSIVTSLMFGPTELPSSARCPPTAR